MTALAAKVLAFIRASALLSPGERVVVAVSGGPDSVALFHLLCELRASLGIELAGVVHVHHGLRGTAADEDEAFVRELSAGLNLPIYAVRRDVRHVAERRGWSIEHAGHAVRHAAFRSALRSLAGDVVATGHTRDDQAETFLLRALRGASSRGLAGIAPRRGTLVRPLLHRSRAEIERYLAARGLSSRHDATNDDCAIPRNRVRHVVLPALERVFAGSRAALARSASIAAEEEAFLEQIAARTASEIVSIEGDVVRLSRSRLLELAAPLQRRVIRRALAGADRRAPTLAVIDSVRRFLGAGGTTLGRRRILAGRFVVSLEGDTAACRSASKGELARQAPGASIPRAAGRRAGRGDAGDRPAWRVELPLPGSIRREGAGWRMDARLAAVVPAGLTADGPVAAFDAAHVAAPLVLRSREAGDRIRPAGGRGSRSVKKLLIDHKVPAVERADVPVVEDAAGRVLWVVGHAVADECRAVPGTAKVLLLEFKPSGGAV